MTSSVSTELFFGVDPNISLYVCSSSHAAVLMIQHVTEPDCFLLGQKASSLILNPFDFYAASFELHQCLVDLCCRQTY